MIERAGVIAEYVAVANAQPTILDNDDAPRLERFNRRVHSLRSAGDAEIRAAGAKRVDEDRRAVLQIPARDGRPHRRCDDGGACDAIR